MKTSHGDMNDPNSKKTIRFHYQKAANTTLSREVEAYLQLLEAISQGNESIVKGLLSASANLLVPVGSGTTASGLAAAKGHMSILAMIIEAEVDINTSHWDPLLHQALRNGHFATAGYLAQAGADLSRLSEVPSLKANLLTMDSDGATPCDLAASNGDLGLWKIIVAAGVDVNINKTDPWLHQTLRNSHFTIAKFLIKSSADVDAKSSENQTAFGAAVLRGCERSISLLHQSGADTARFQESC
jgi:ankyrin repeat protein